MKIQIVLIALLAAFAHADISSKLDEIKNTIAKELEELKGNLNSAKDKFEACTKEPGKGYVACLKEMTEAKLKETFGGRQTRDVSGKIDEIKAAAIKEYEAVKAAITDVKNKFEACTKEPGKGYLACAKEFYESGVLPKLEALKKEAEQKINQVLGRQKRDVAGKVDEIKAAAIKEYEAIKAAITDVKNKFEACTKEAGKGYFACAKEFFDSGILPKLEALKAEAEQKLKQIMGRQKRASGNDIAWYPSAEEVAAAKQIKICLDMGKDKAECYAKVLGANGDKFDAVKLETITKYEDVLRELRQFHAIWNQGGRNIRECLLELHKQQTATKQRGFIPQNVQDLTNLKTVVLECMAAAKANDVSKCAVAIFGPEVAGSDKIALIQQLVNHPKVQEFAKGAGQKLHEYLTSMSGVVAQIHDWAHSTYNWAVNVFG